MGGRPPGAGGQWRSLWFAFISDFIVPLTSKCCLSSCLRMLEKGWGKSLSTHPGRFARIELWDFIPLENPVIRGFCFVFYQLKPALTSWHLQVERHGLVCQGGHRRALMGAIWPFASTGMTFVSCRMVQSVHLPRKLPRAAPHRVVRFLCRSATSLPTMSVQSRALETGASLQTTFGSIFIQLLRTTEVT